MTFKFLFRAIIIWLSTLMNICLSRRLVARGLFGLQSVAMTSNAPVTAELRSKIKNSVQKFWFEETTMEQKFAIDANFDGLIRDRFGEWNAMARNQGLDEMRQDPQELLALLILLDQFNRNLFRDSPDAFSSDSYCVELVEHALANDYDKELMKDTDHSLGKLQFLLLPLMHSEELAKQDQLLAKMEELEMDKNCPMMYGAAKMHHEDIERFGRFPSRNKALGRVNTPEEQTFLDSLSGPRFSLPKKAL